MKRRIAVLLLVLLFVIAGLMYFERLSTKELAHQQNVADVVQPFAVSFGAIIAALGGFSLIGDWLQKRQHTDDLVRYWQKKFPISKLGKPNGYRFIEKEGAEGIIFLHDLKNKRRHWVSNLQTLRKVWMPNPERQTLPAKEFEEIQPGEHIDIKT
jgi:hypothetical protein